MEHEQVQREVARQSAWIYLPISLGNAFLFFVAALLGGFPPVAIYGGAIWVALLSLIIAMPIVTARVKKKNKRG